LCKLARAYRQNNRATYVKLPQGEKLFLQALDQIDTGEFIAMSHEKNPMLRIAPDDENPYDPQYRRTMNGKRYHA
jgi:hypothetical protein